MRYSIVSILILLLLTGPVCAQKNKSPYKLRQPRRDHKAVKTGFVGESHSRKSKRGKIKFVGKDPSRKHKRGSVGFVGLDPSMDRPKVKYMVPSMGKSKKSRLRVSNGKIKPPKRRVKFLAADRSTHARDNRVRKSVTDKQMILPKMRGDKKTKMPKTGYVGLNPNMGANAVKEKHNSDIQYKTAYKFGKKGGLDKTSRRH